MASLRLSKADLQAELGLYLGWGRGADNGDEEWDAQEKALLKSFVDSGYSRFLNTPPIEGFDKGGHDWTFLKPRLSLLAPAGSAAVELPDDFGGFNSELTIVDDTAASARTVKLVNEMMLRLARQKSPGQTGRPLYGLVSPVKGAPGRFELQLFPTPDADYKLEGRYNLVPEALSDAYPYAYGGALHRETLLESVLAVAEERWDRIANGPHALAFVRCLTASIRQDRQFRPQVYGYDADHSDSIRGVFRDFPRVTVNGIEPK